MGIRFGWAVILAVGLSQAALLVWGGRQAHQWLGARTRHSVERQVVDDNRATAAHLSQLITAMDLKSVEFGGASWHRLQGLVETLNLPNKGHVTIVRMDDGGMIAHPELRRDNSLTRTRPGQAILEVDSKEGMIIDLVRRYRSSEPVLSGYVDLNEGRYLAAATSIDELNAAIIVHQKLDVIRAGIDDWLSVVEERGAWLIGSLAVLGMFVNSVVLWGFNSQLPRIQRDSDLLAARKSKRLVESREAVIFALAKLAEARDSDTGDHLDRIRFYTDVLARELRAKNPQINDDFLDDVALASALHDIGKAGIPDEVLLKPGRLTDEERVIIQKHSAIGGACLTGVLKRVGTDHLLQLAVDITTYHHERWDGEGYPTRRRAEDIPLAARIVSVADVYDALTSRRPYKAAMSHAKAKEIISAESGKQFDPQVVDAFITQEAAFEQIRVRYQDTVDDVSHVSAVAVESENVSARKDRQANKKSGKASQKNVNGAEPLVVTSGTSNLH